MLIPKADRKKIHEYIFKEGVLVAKKDFNQPKHGDIDTKNLYVCILESGRSSIANGVTGHQSMPIPHLSGLSEDPVLLAILLLHPDP